MIISPVKFNTNNLERNTVSNFVNFGQKNDTFEKQESTQAEDRNFWAKSKEKIDETANKLKNKIIDTIRDILPGLRNKETLNEVQALRVKFQKTPEGIRRSKMSNKEIEMQAKAILQNIFTELNIPKSQQPTFHLNSHIGVDFASYIACRHVINYSAEMYKIYPDEMDKVLMHEMTHCKEALKVAGIPQKRVDEIIKNELISRITNGENIKVKLFATKMITPPKMPNEMKNDFAEFAKNNLYNKSSSSLGVAILCRLISKENNMTLLNLTNHKILGELKAIIEKYPEFQNQYKNEDKALQALVDYSLSHYGRYKSYTDTEIAWGKVKVEELQGEELKAAEQSLINRIDTMERNDYFAKDFNKISMMGYLFCNEEVLAEINGHKYSIENMKKKYDKMKTDGTLTESDKEYMETQLKASQMEIEYRAKGLEFYNKLLYSRNHSDKSLDDEIEELGKKLEKLHKNIKKLDERFLQIRE